MHNRTLHLTYVVVWQGWCNRLPVAADRCVESARNAPHSRMVESGTPGLDTVFLEPPGRGEDGQATGAGGATPLLTKTGSGNSPRPGIDVGSRIASGPAC